MRKIVSIVLALMLIGTIAFAQGPKGQGPKGEGMRGPGMNRLIFGISQKDFKALGLSEAQQKQIMDLQKAFNEKYLPKQPKPGEEAKPCDCTPEKIEKCKAEQKKAYEEMYATFRSILTEDQAKAYDTAFKAQVEKTKKQLTKQYATIGEKIALTNEQKTELDKLIKDYNGCEMSFNENFMKLLTDEQKTAFQAYQKEQMEQMMKDRKGGPKCPNGEMMPPPEGCPQNCQPK